MTMTKNKTNTGPPSTTSRRSIFLACFGYSGEKNMQLIDHKVNSGSRRHRRMFDWKFSCRKSTTKTVHVLKSKSDKTWEIQVVEEDASLTKKHVIMVDTKHVSDEQKTSRKKWTDIVKRQNGSTRQKDIKPAATSATDAGIESPVKKTIVNASPLKPLTQSKSLPAGFKKQKPTKAPPAGGGVDYGVVDKPTSSSGGEFDSMIAMAILLVILMIMVLWGKLCAIICTCAWFFIAPRLVAARGRSVVDTAERQPSESQNKLSLESVEYKKKVVLEGLLQRNHRSGVGRL